MKKTTNNVGKARFRLWTFLVYPDSAPADWLGLLDDLHVPALVSPLHLPDSDSKKEHWHVLLNFEGVKSGQQVLDLIEEFNGPGYAEVVESSRAMVRYFCHLDHPDKQQYDPSEMLPFGGIDLQQLLLPNHSETFEFAHQIHIFCKDTGITEFANILDYSEQFRPDWYYLLLMSPVSKMLEKFLQSSRHSQKEKTYIPLDILPHD